MDQYITIRAADAALAKLAISRYRADLEQFLDRELHAIKFGQ